MILQNAKLADTWAFCYHNRMLDAILIGLVVILSGALIWTWFHQEALHRQLAKSTQQLNQERQRAQISKEEERQAPVTPPAEPLQQEVPAESNQRFLLAQKASRDVLYDLEVASGKVQWGDALFDLFGYQRDESVDTIEWWTAHIHPDDAMKLNEVMNGLTDPGATNWEVEYRLQKADQSYVQVHDRSFVLRNQQGKAARLVGSMYLLEAKDNPVG